MRSRRRRLLVATTVVVLAIVALVAVALAGDFDAITTKRVHGSGVRVVRVGLVDAALGFDVTPDVVVVDPGAHLVLRVVNDGDEVHDLALYGGAIRTRMLEPGESQRLDVGIVGGDLQAWCTLSGHKLFGMNLEIRVARPGEARSPATTPG